VNDVYTASSIYLRIAQQYCQVQNINFVGLCDQLKIDPDTTRINSIPLEKVLEAWQCLTKTCKNNLFGFSAGVNSTLNDYGVFSHAIMNCDNIYEALKLIHSYRHLMCDAFESSLDTKEGVTEYIFNISNLQSPSSQLVEFHMASIISLGRDLATSVKRDHIKPLRVEFSHPKHNDIAYYKEYFDCEFLFDMPVNKLVIEHEVLMIPTHFPDEALFKNLINKVENIYCEQYDVNKTIQKTRRYLEDAENIGEASLTTAALQAGFSESTLKRHLKAEGSSFQFLYDEIRYQKAKKLLFSYSSTKDVSVQLGFSNQGSFARAFKRWSGISPQEYVLSNKKF